MSKAEEPRRSGAGALLAVFGLALAVRLTVAEQLRTTTLYLYPQLDAMEFLRWARAIAGGDFSWPSYPTHGPAYPWLLGGLLWLFDDSLRLARAVQAVLGAGTCVLVASLTSRFFGRPSGFLAGLLLAFYGPLAFAETALWEDALLIFLLVATLWLFTHPARSLRTAVAAGLALGVAGIVRPTPLVLLPGLVALLFWPARWPRPRRAALALTVACLAVVAPVVAAASKAAGTFLFVRGFGAINLYIGNDPDGGGAQNARLGGAWDRLESAPFRDGVGDKGALEGYYTRKTLERIAERPLAFLGVLASKAVWLTQAEELRDNHSYRFFQQRSLVLHWLPGFGVLLALAVPGLVVAWRRRQLPPALVWYLLAMAAVPLATLVGLRYRLPAIPALACFAGLGAATLIERLRAPSPWPKRLRAAAPLLALAAGVWAASHMRNHPPSRNLAEEWVLSGSSLATEGELDGAEEAFRAALEEDPGAGIAWDGIGRVRFAQGRVEEARQAFARAIERDPDLRRGHYHHGLTLERLGRPAEALEAYRKAVAIAPRYLAAQLALGRLLLAAGDLDGAAEALTRALEVDPGHRQALLGLARIEGARGNAAAGLDHARGAARSAAAGSDESVEAWLLVGFLAINAGDLAAAEEALAGLGANRAAARSDQALLLRASVEFQRGDPRAAQATLRDLLRRNPNLPPAVQLYLATAQALGNRDEAIAFLESVRGGPP